MQSHLPAMRAQARSWTWAQLPQLYRPAWPHAGLLQGSNAGTCGSAMNITGSITDVTCNSNHTSSWGVFSHPWIVPREPTQSGTVASCSLVRKSKPFFRAKRIRRDSVACPGDESLPKSHDVKDPPKLSWRSSRARCFLSIYMWNGLNTVTMDVVHTPNSSKTFQGTERWLQSSMQVSMYTNEFLRLGKAKQTNKKVQNIPADKYKISNATENTKQQPKYTAFPENSTGKWPKSTWTALQAGGREGAEVTLGAWWPELCHGQLQSTGCCIARSVVRLCI